MNADSAAFEQQPSNENELDFARRLNGVSAQLKAHGEQLVSCITNFAASMDPELQQLRRRLEQLNG